MLKPPTLPASTQLQAGNGYREIGRMILSFFDNTVVTVVGLYSRICFPYNVIVVWNATVWFDSNMPSWGRHWLYLHIHVASCCYLWSFQRACRKVLVFAGPPQVLTLPFGPLRTPVADMMRFLELVCFILITCNIIDCSEEEEPQ